MGKINPMAIKLNAAGAICRPHASIWVRLVALLPAALPPVEENESGFGDSHRFGSGLFASRSGR
jgi:hypothetical protein